MSETLNFTLLSEGSSDRALLPILEWIVGQHAPLMVINKSWVDTNRLPHGKISTPRDRLRSAVEVYPCNILFVHRDEDGSGWEERLTEINEWLVEAQLAIEIKSVPIIPIRKSEAWLLIDEVAIRRAAGNPRGNVHLDLPALRDIERIADPKRILFDALLAASELSGRRLKKFDRNQARLSVANYITQKDLLRQLIAFQRLESNIIEALQILGMI